MSQNLIIGPSVNCFVKKRDYCFLIIIFLDFIKRKPLQKFLDMVPSREMFSISICRILGL